MSAHVVVHATIKDAEKFQEYGAAAGPTAASFGGEVISRGVSTSLHGDKPGELKVIIQFPTKDAAENWYNSSEYQKLIPTRNEGIDSIFVLGGE